MAASLCAQPRGDLGIFEGQSDVGNTELEGWGAFDSARKEYRVTGNGANIWSALSATLRFTEAGVAGHDPQGGIVITYFKVNDCQFVEILPGLKKAAYQRTLEWGMTEDRKLPRFGLDERWQFNLFDPDGTRVEFMQPRDPAKAGVPVPSR